LESLCWASLNGSYDDVLACLTPQAQAGALNDGSRREQHESVRTATAQLYRGLQITAKKVLSEDKVELKFRNDHDPTISQIPEVQHVLKYGVQTLVKVGNEWKVEGLPRSFDESWEQEGQIERFAQ